jgi:uncharacterized protein YdgA (DUF945 family)
MKKIIVAIVVVIVACGLGLPPLVGSMTESTVRTHIDAWNENPMFAFRVESYERNWFSSEARIAVSIDRDYARMAMPSGDPSVNNLAAAMVADFSLPFTLEVQHGPIVFSDGVFVGLSTMVARISEDSEIIGEIQRQLAMPYVVQMNGRIGLTGTFDFDGDVPPIDYADESSEVLFSGAEFGGRYKGRHLESRGKIDEISFNAGTGSAVINGISMSGDTQMISAMLGIGTVKAAVERIVVNDALSGPDPTVNIDRLGFSSSTNLDDSGKLMSGTFTYSSDSIVAPASDLDLQNVQVSLGVANISVEAVTDYYEAMLAVDPNDPGAAMQNVQSFAMRLLENSPSLSIAPIHFEYGGEPFDGDVELRTNGAALRSGGIDFTNPLALATMFEATINADASKTLVAKLATQAVAAQLAASMPPEAFPPGQDVESMAEAQVQLMLVTLLGQGFLVDDGDTYRTSIAYANGEILVNGTPLPLGAFL